MKGLYVAIGVILLIVLWAGCGYNGMNSKRIEVNKQWAGVQAAYQRRADLIPNLVATVKGVADFEKSTYVQVAMARAGQLKTAAENTTADNVTPEKMAQLQNASKAAMESARMAINIAVERYPELKANENFSKLQDELAGTENRINTSRRDFNDAVADYNVKVTSFPNNLLAGMFGYKEKDMFKADEGAQNAPKVKF